MMASGGESSERDTYRTVIDRGDTGGDDGFNTTPTSVTSNLAAGYTAPASASVPGNLFLNYWLRVSRTAQIRARGAEMAEFLGYQLNRLKDVWSQHRHGRMREVDTYAGEIVPHAARAIDLIPSGRRKPRHGTEIGHFCAS
jgi:hypothetical protein